MNKGDRIFLCEDLEHKTASNTSPKRRLLLRKESSKENKYKGKERKYRKNENKSVCG